MPRIQHKRGTSANLASVNPTPLAGELVWDSTENAIKIGDGATGWTSLAYVTATPRSHTHSADAITSGTVAYARLPVGSTAATVCAGDDARLSDARTPTAHKASHATGGSDALTPADIGAATAASPTFSGVVTVPAGTGAAPGLVSSLAATAGIFFPAADVVAISTAGASRIRIGSDGRVGIGKTATQTLDVNGVIASLGGSAGAPSQTFTGDPDSGIFSAGSNTFAVATGGSERLRVDSSGRLGIGGTPTATLDVNANTMRLRTARTPASASATGNAGDICWDADFVYICTATNTWRKARLSADGQTFSSAVGVRTEANDGSYTTLTSDDIAFATSSQINARLEADATQAYLRTEQSTPLLLGTGNTERVRIKSNGAVRFVPLASDPASGEAGDVYYNSANNKLRVYNGTSWVDLH